MGKSDDVGSEGVQQIRQLIRVDLSLHVQLLHQHVHLLVVYYSVLVTVHLLEHQRQRSDLLAMLPQREVQH